MAIFHLSVKVISRSNGSSSVAAAAYRSASRLHDDRLDRARDFSKKAGVVWSEVMLPPGAPEAWRDREVLWNAVEAAEVRRDAQLAREVEFALPRELTREEGVELARDYVRREFVDRGTVADLNVHWDVGADGEAKPHVHVMLALREVGPEGFGAKVNDWKNRTEVLKGWREAWADQVNEALAERGIDQRVDHRSLQAQGLDLEPQGKIGAAGARREDRGEDAERAAEHRDIARRNGERILADPSIALEAITRQQATFTRQDLARFLHRHTGGAEQFEWALAAVEDSPERVRLGHDGDGRERFTSREMIGVEQALAKSAETLAERRDHGMSGRAIDASVRRNAERGFVPSREQVTALAHVAQPSGLSVVGYAGAGKSAMLDMARIAWEADGRRVQGAALSGMAAEKLTSGSGIEARTLASLEHAWDRGRDLLQPGDVLVVDEAGLVGLRQLQRVLGAVEAAGAKAVLVGDAEQLQAIRAGAAFRVLGARHGAAELKSVRRQVEPWQQQVTRHLATGRTPEALAAYASEGALRGHETTEDAREAMVAAWVAHRLEKPEESRLLMAHTRADVAELNAVARERLRNGGELGEDRQVSTELGSRTFAVGDRIIFLRNEWSLGVRNGSLGDIEELSASRMSVRLSDGRQVAFDLKDYADLDHGYATTIHKAQGATVDRAWVLATPGLDRHATYVAMSRHRAGVSLHWSLEDFRNVGDLARRLGRERAKDSTLGYAVLQAEAGRSRPSLSREDSRLQPAWRPPRERDRGRER
ncbi:MAG TPA: Ti-type conjugative transfer relaxase TraA [Phenylobacterium sp.]|jgi:Ti-type conjugative transfer relaxase TraA